MTGRSGSTPDPTRRQGPEDLLEAWRSAETSGDVAELGALLCDDFVGVGPRGWRRTREQWIDRYASGAVVTSRLELRDVTLRVHDSAALVVAEQHQEGRNGEHDTSGRFLLTLTAVRTDGAWRIAGLHVGPLLD